MALILSKLLPLFIYPVGLSSLLMLLAFVTLVRRRGKFVKTAATAIGLALLILVLSSIHPVSNFLLRSLEWQNLPTELPNAGAIVVLGGGTRPRIPPRPWTEVNEAGDRILYGSKLFLAGKAPLLIVSGGRADWLGEGGNPEAEDMTVMARAMGVPTEAIAQDATSLNTRENAANVRQILQQRQIQRILLVTSALHMPRALAIFRKLGIEAIAAPTDFLTVHNTNDKGWAGTLLDLLPDSDALKNTTNVLKEYVGLLVYKLQGWA